MDYIIEELREIRAEMASHRAEIVNGIYGFESKAERAAYIRIVALLVEFDTEFEF